MKTIYFVDENGKKVYVEVSDEVAAAYRDCQREEWRSDAYESYHAISLDRLTETGYEVADRSATIEQRQIERAERLQRRKLLAKLKKVLPQLTELQRATVHKLFVLNMTQADIAREENVARSTIKERVDGIYSKLRKLLEKS